MVLKLPENFEELSSSLPSVSVKQVVKTVIENLEAWRKLVSSLGSVTEAVPGTGGGGGSDHSSLIAVIKILGKICSDQCIILEEDEVANNGGDDDEDEVSRQALARILRTICYAEFFGVVTRKIAEWTMMQSKRAEENQDFKQRNMEVLTCLHNLCRHLMEILPLTAKDACANLVLMTLGIMNASYLKEELPHILLGFQKIQESILAANKEFEKTDEKKPGYGFSEEQERMMHEREPPNDFRTIQICPTVKELLTDKRPFLRPNKAKGGYVDAEHYLDVQFRLLREDFVQPLRKGVEEEFLALRDEYIRSNGKRRRRDVNQNSSVRVYTGVTFHDKQISPHDKSVSYLFNLPANLVKKVNWEKSKRLLPGSLLLLTSDFCQTASFATVLTPPIDWSKEKDKEKGRVDPRRKELIEGVLRVSVETGVEFIHKDNPHVMLECEAFFEAYRYNLGILQKMNLADFPLQKFLVNPDTSISATPSYMIRPVEREGPMDLKIKLPFLTEPPASIDGDNQKANLGIRRLLARMAAERKPQPLPCLVSVLDAESWPSQEIQQKMGLDNNQYAAYRAALTSEFSIIQGPPGTGKTFIGLKIVETILLNKQKDRSFLHSNGSGEGMYPNSPILVVCYTNHALDQFLELIQSCQEDINLVRVGGQCKSEKVLKCTLAEQRKRLRFEGCRTVDLSHQQSVVRRAMYEARSAEASLQDLRCDIETLSSFSALIEFKILQCYRREFDRHQEHLTKHIPTVLMGIFTSRRYPSFLGLIEDGFRDPDFSPTNLLRSFFKLKSQRPPQKSTSLQQQTAHLTISQQLVASSNASAADLRMSAELRDVDVEEEEYDFDELVEQRVLDVGADDYWDVYEDFKNSNKASATSHHQSVSRNWSVNSLRSYLHAVNSTIRDVEQKIYEHREEVHRSRKERQNMKSCNQCGKLNEWHNNEVQKRIETDNKLKFIYAVFGHYEKGMLDLPDISIYLKNEKQNGGKSNADCGGHVLFPMDVEENEGDRSVDGLEDEGDSSGDDGLEDEGDSSDDETWIQPDFMSMDERWALYFHIANLCKELSTKLVPIKEKEIVEANKDLNLQRHMADGLILKQSDIIGMTTTGASKFHDLLEIAKPEIVIIEEAAEILEAHTVTSLTEHCKHLILIGDHLQLRPSTNVYHLARKFHMDLSLFERMINNGMNLWTLKTQHRMRPEIAELIVGPIYSELHNHESVLHYPDVRGVAKNLFLISHNELEETDKDMLSKSNAHEADFLIAFCHYLLQQGYDPDKITILTTYTGQMFLLKKKFSREWGRVRITCIDNYQGEENDIILLSLVRSNEEDKIGFVGIDNRICVALSRAKHGLFIMGNVKSLTSRSATWKKIYEKLAEKGNCDEGLPLKCERHQTITHVKRGKDFVPLNLGGCTLTCDFKLGCGHLCVRKCHGLDLEHKEYECKEKCEKLCRKGLHPCAAKCFRKCPPCTVEVINQLKCGHQKQMCCFKEPGRELCEVIVTRVLPKCKHEELLPCNLDYRRYICKRRVRKLLECGHYKEMECHADEKRVTCKEMVEKVLVPCGHSQFLYCHVEPVTANCLTEVNVVFPGCNHERKMVCSKREKEQCEVKCQAVLECGHKCDLSCHVTNDPNHDSYICKKRCQRHCNSPEHHPCRIFHLCFKPCPPCTVPVTRTLPCHPEHTGDVACSGDVKNCKCQCLVDRQLDCGHTVKMKCHDTNRSKMACSVQVKKTLSCGHVGSLKCSESIDKINCNELKLMKCPKCHHERHVVCRIASSSGCIKAGCRQKYPRKVVPESFKQPENCDNATNTLERSELKLPTNHPTKKAPQNSGPPATPPNFSTNKVPHPPPTTRPPANKRFLGGWASTGGIFNMERRGRFSTPLTTLPSYPTRKVPYRPQHQISPSGRFPTNHRPQHQISPSGRFPTNHRPHHQISPSGRFPANRRPHHQKSSLPTTDHRFTDDYDEW